MMKIPPRFFSIWSEQRNNFTLSYLQWMKQQNDNIICRLLQLISLTTQVGKFELGGVLIGFFLNQLLQATEPGESNSSVS